jgi:hypothetical protein
LTDPRVSVRAERSFPETTKTTFLGSEHSELRVSMSSSWGVLLFCVELALVRANLRRAKRNETKPTS